MAKTFWSAVSRLAISLVAIVLTLGVMVYGRELTMRPKVPTTNVAQVGAVQQPLPEEKDIRTPLVRSLVDALSKMDATVASDDDRRLVREQLLRADRELSTTLGDNSRNRILQANQRVRSFRIPAANDRAALPPPRPALVPGASGRVGNLPKPAVPPTPAN